MNSSCKFRILVVVSLVSFLWVNPASVTAQTNPEVLEKIESLGGVVQLDSHGNVWALNFARCPLNDGDLEILHELPFLLTMTIRGANLNGGKITTDGLRPLASLPYLHRLDLSKNSLLQGSLETITGLQYLQFLDLNGTDFDDRTMLDLRRLPNLRHLRVADTDVTEAGVRFLHGTRIEELDHDWGLDVSVLGGLKHLRVVRGQREVTLDRLVEFRGCDKLASIVITDGGPATPEAMAALRSLTSLETVEIGVTGSDWSLLQALDSHSRLKKLRLLHIDDEAMQHLPLVQSLESLGMRFSDAGNAWGLQNLKKFPALRQLSLNPETTTSSGLKEVAKCSQLESLSFHGAHEQFVRRLYKVDDGEQKPGFTAESLRPLLEKPGLKELYLDGLGFGDEVLEVISLAEDLRVLSLRELPVTDRGLEHLKCCRNLRELYIFGTEVTGIACLKLQKEHLHRCMFEDNWSGAGDMGFEPLIETKRENASR